MVERATAVVTGASRGIGRAVALELAARGHSVVATMRDPDDGRDLPDAITVERLDVTDPATIHLPSTTQIAVNNAGVETDNLPIEHGDVDRHWRYLFEANVFGLVRVTQAAVPILRANGGGVICNLTSSSILAPVPFLGMYRASKAAVAALGESLAAEVAPFGIRVVEILPGPIITDMLRTSERPAAAIDFEEYRAQAEAMWELRRSIIDQYTPAEDAARRIVDAIEEADTPGTVVRRGCDPLSDAMLAAVTTRPFER
jgi:NAD(P)-dependent dehydrogenase (short-subunit alcohol dehydrogenase family)